MQLKNSSLLKKQRSARKETFLSVIMKLFSLLLAGSIAEQCSDVCKQYDEELNLQINRELGEWFRQQYDAIYLVRRNVVFFVSVLRITSMCMCPCSN